MSDPDFRWRTLRLWMPLLVGSIGLLAIAWKFGTQLDGDPFAHYLHATAPDRTLESVICDTWTRPLVTLAFRPGRWFGINGVVIVAVALSVLAGLFNSLSLRRMLPDSETSALILPTFFLQWAIMEVGWLTMTEVPFYVTVSAGIYLFLSRHARSAYFVIGLLPLCRTEGIVIAAIMGVGLLLCEPGLRMRQRGARVALLTAPFVLWMILGAAVSGEILWHFSRHTYQGVISLRTGPVPWLLLCNGITRLPSVFPALLLPFLFSGMLGFPSLVRLQPRLWLALGGLIAATLGLLSIVISFPDERAAFFAGGPTRVYGIAAPALALFTVVGVVLAAERPASREVRLGAVGAFVLVLLAWPLDILNRMGIDAVPRALYVSDAAPAVAWWPLGRSMISHALGDPHTLRYGAVVMSLGALSIALSRKALAARIAGLLRVSILSKTSTGRALGASVLISVLLLLIAPVSPRRLGPTRQAVERRVAAFEALGAWYRRQYPKNGPQVVQQMTPDLGYYLRTSEAGVASWTWNAEIEERMQFAPPGTLFVAGIVRPGAPARMDAWFEGDSRFKRIEIPVPEAAAAITLYEKR